MRLGAWILNDRQRNLLRELSENVVFQNFTVSRKATFLVLNQKIFHMEKLSALWIQQGKWIRNILLQIANHIRINILHNLRSSLMSFFIEIKGYVIHRWNVLQTIKIILQDTNIKQCLLQGYSVPASSLSFYTFAKVSFKICVPKLAYTLPSWITSWSFFFSLHVR